MSKICENWNYDIHKLDNIINKNLLVEYGYSTF
jgi:hypothetical protein